MSEAAQKASVLGRLLERRISARFGPHCPPLECLEETVLTQAYGDCCFGIDHFFRFGTKQVHVQEKWESAAPKLRDLRHFVVASTALTTKLPVCEPPLRVFLSRRPITAPESLFVLQASCTESLADFGDIDSATEALYSRVCAHFGLEPVPMTAELAQQLAGLKVDDVAAPAAHPDEETITGLLRDLEQVTIPQVLSSLYGERLVADTTQYIQDFVHMGQLGAVLRFFGTRRHSAAEYDAWLAILQAIRPIQVLMEKVNSETGRRRYFKSAIGPPAIYPTEAEINAQRQRFMRRRRGTQVTVIQEGKDN